MAFVHPGGLHSQADLDRMKAQVAAGAHPWIDGWNRLIADSQAQNTYTAAAQANMGVSRQRASADAHAAYLNTIRWYVSGDASYADCAVRICNAWSAVVNQVPSGTDIPGLSGIPIAEFAYVGELLRIYPGWVPADFDRFKNMMTTYWYPVCHDFLVRHNNACDSHYWANWDACNMGALVGIGVLCDNQPIFDEGVEYFKNGIGSGSIMHAVYYVHPDGLGQWQESGRDQEHAQLGVGLLSSLCEVAWHQGLDLYGYAGNRLLAGAEYVARTNLSRPVPYAPYNNCDTVNEYYLSINGLGRLDDRPLWELIYNHYVVRKGLSAPNVKAMAQLMRPEHGSADHFGYGTLTFTLDGASSPYPASPVPPAPLDVTATAGVGRVTLRWTPPSGDTATGYAIRRATVSGGPYTTIASWTDNTYPEYTDTGVTNGTSYYYVVAPINQSGTGANSAEVQAKPAAAGALPDGWARQDVGTVASAGSATYAAVSNNTFIVGGNGSGIGGASDSLSYSFATVSGDCTFTARLLVNGLTKVGLMMRESTNAGAAALSLTLGDTGGRETRFGTRASSGTSMSFQSGNDYTWTPVWYKLERSGSTFTASQSLDGVTWFMVGTSTASLPAAYQVGFAVCGGTATFDNVAVQGVVLAGPPSNVSAVNGDAKVTLTWTAAGGASGYNVKRATVSGGPYTTIASGVTATSYVDAGLPNGATYYYVVSSIQGSYESLNSSEATGSPGDIAFTWSTTPASGNWSRGANWLGGLPPTTPASLTFAASPITALTNDISGLAVTKLTFNSGAPAFAISGSSVSLFGDILNSASATQTIGLNIALAGPRTITASGGAITVTGVISDGGAGYGLVKLGSQTLSLTGLNTFSGNVTHTTGTLSIAGIGSGTVGTPTAGALGRGVVQLGGGVLTSSAAALVYNNIVVQPSTTTSIASTVANITLAGNISGSGAINESGANVGGTHFNGDNSGFTGTFTSSNATNHRVRFNSATAGSASATWILNNSQTDGYGLTFGNGTISFGALSGGGQFRSDSANGTTGVISVGALNTDTTFTGVMVANGTRFIGLTKVGTGTLTLTATHTYNGQTTVTAGTLLVNGAIASPTTVTGGTFGGAGRSSAALTIGTGTGSGATFAPGNRTIGTFTTTGPLALNADARFAIELNGTSGLADKAVAAGVTIDNALLSLTNVSSGALPIGAALTIIDNTGATPVSGNFFGLPEGALVASGANTFRVSYQGGTGNDVVLTAVVPPPVITSDAVASGTVGIPFGFALTATNAPTSFGANGLPAGLVLDPVTGTISGTPSSAGVFSVSIAAANSTASATGALTITIGKGSATVTLGNLAQIYSGIASPVTVATTPAGLAVDVTYDGAGSVPVHAGNYSVAANVTDANYAGSAAASLTIAKATPRIGVTPYRVTYDGSAHTAMGTATGVNGESLAGLNLSATKHTDAGTYDDTWSFIDVTGNYTDVSGSVTDTIAKAPATIAFAPLTQAYDGAPKPVIATTSPAGLQVNLIYDGSTDAPVLPGAHTVVGTIVEPNYTGKQTDNLTITITALVNRAPSLNGDLDGSLQMRTGENVALNGATGITGDLLVPGTPEVQINGEPAFGGVQDHEGSGDPSTYRVTLNGGVLLRFVERRVDPIAMPVVAAPSAPTGTRDVALHSANQNPGSFATIRDLTLNGNAGNVALPPGNYGNLAASGTSAFTLGVMGATEPSIYAAQQVTLNGNTNLHVMGPVILTLANGVTLNAEVGNAEHPEWLTLQIASGGVTLNGGATLHGIVIAPAGVVVVNGHAVLHGRITADQLTLNGGAVLQP